jgi:hypothetical protein
VRDVELLENSTARLEAIAYRPWEAAVQETFLGPRIGEVSEVRIGVK